MTYTSLKQVKANVTTKWSHPNCKFMRGDRVTVNNNVLPGLWTGTDGAPRIKESYWSEPIMNKAGSEGHVVAASCTPDGRMRGKAPGGFCERMYTRYYVQFADRSIYGIHSHALDFVE